MRLARSPILSVARQLPHRRAALEQRGHRNAGQERSKPVAQCHVEQMPQVLAERAHDAAVHHVQAPQQQRHTTHQVEKNHRCHARLFPTN